jgi:hypothetical protein
MIDPEAQLYLVKLPKSDFYGVGSFVESGDFNFILLQPEMFVKAIQPIRTVRSGQRCEILGEINHLSFKRITDAGKS